MGTLFKQKQKVRVLQPETLTPGQRSLLDQLTGVLTGQVGAGVQAYPGQITPGPSALQTQAFGALADTLGGGGIMAPATESLKGLMGQYDPTQAMDYWTKAVKEPAMRTWQEELVPQILEKYGAQNALSSSAFGQTLARSGANLASNLAGTLAQTILGEKGQHAQTQLGAATGYGNLAQNILSQVLGAGQTQRGIQAEQMAEPYQKWAYEQPYSNPWLSLLGPALTTPAFENVPYTREMAGRNLGMSCCFIFNEGERLTEAVKRYRDKYFPPDSYVSKGYKIMAKWLVPWMRKSRFVKRVVQKIMLNPLSSFAEAVEAKSQKGWFYAPIGIFWCSTWDQMGRLGRIFE